MNLPQPSPRQPLRLPWARARLLHERSIALGCAIDVSSAASYSSALQSYLSFCRSHDFPIEPTPDTLSFFTVYMSHHIKPSSVNSYLSGICNQLEPFFPNVRHHRRHPLVTRTLRGCRKLRALPTSRKTPLSRTELASLRDPHMSGSYDDVLFFTQLVVGFHALLRLGELVWPDNASLRDYRKVTKRHTVELLPLGFSFLLPSHKADRFFEGNRVILQRLAAPDDPDSAFRLYLRSRDHRFPLHSPLWLRTDGSIPTRGWFIRRLRHHFPSDVGGHSLCAGGAMALAQAGVAPNIIQATGRWASDTFQVYIRQHPVLLAALLYGQPSVGPQ
jgi:hypothetical protein